MKRRFSDREHAGLRAGCGGLGRAVRILSCAVALTFAAAAVAPSALWADDGGSDGADADGSQYSKAHRRGKALYERKRWKAARKQFQRAYDIIPKPIQLFNIGSTYRSEGNYIKALFFYHRYLAEAPSDAPYRAFANTAITELDAKIAAQKAEAKRQEKVEQDREREERALEARRARELTARPSSPVADDPPNRALQVVGAMMVVVGVGGVGFGGYEAYNAQKIAAELDDKEDGTVWSPELQARFDSGESASTRALVFSASGGAAVVLGTILYVIGQGDSSSSAAKSESLSISPYSGNGSAGVIVRAAF